MAENNRIEWYLPPHCGHCGSLLVGSFCGVCGERIPTYPQDNEPLVWLLLPRIKEARFRQFEEQLAQIHGYREEIIQDDILHALPLNGNNWQQGTLGLFLPKFLSWPGAMLKTYSGFYLANNSPAFAAYSAFFQQTTAAGISQLAQMAERVNRFSSNPDTGLLALAKELVTIGQTEPGLLLTPQAGAIIHNVLTANGLDLSSLANYLAPRPQVLSRTEDEHINTITPADEHPASRLTTLKVPAKVKNIKLIAEDCLLFQDMDNGWHFAGPRGEYPLSLPGELAQIWTFVDSTALLAVKNGSGLVPLLLKAPLSTVKQQADSAPFSLLEPPQDESFQFSFDPLAGQLWVLYDGGQLCCYTWNRSRQTFIANRSWQLSGLAAPLHHHQGLQEEFVSLVPHYVLTREKEHFLLYYFQNRTVKRAILDITLQAPRLLTCTSKDTVLLLDGTALYEISLWGTHCHFREMLLPGPVNGWSVERQKVWLAGKEWLLAYEANDNDDGLAVYPVAEEAYVTQLGPMLVTAGGELRQYLSQAGNSLPIPPWPQREADNRLQKAFSLPPSEARWFKLLIAIISQRDLGALLSFCVATIDRSSGLILERRIYLMLQEIEKRRWYVASKAVVNYYADRSGAPNLYLALSLVIHQYLWQGSREQLREELRKLAVEQTVPYQNFILDRLAQLYLLAAQELWQQAYDCVEALEKEAAAEPALYDFIQPELSWWYEVITALAYGDSLKPAAPEEWFICRLAAVLRNLSDAHLNPLIKECGGWITRLRNI